MIGTGRAEELQIKVCIRLVVGTRRVKAIWGIIMDCIRLCDRNGKHEAQGVETTFLKRIIHKFELFVISHLFEAPRGGRLSAVREIH